MKKTCKLSFIIILSLLLLSGCTKKAKETTATIETPSSLEPKIAVTSVACMQICEKLNLNLVGIPQTTLVDIPQRYQSAQIIGSPMSPDLENLAVLSPDWVLSPQSLQADLQPKYDAAGLNYCFLNLKSVAGMYKCIEQMGELFSRTSEASALIADFKSFYLEYQTKHMDDKKPNVLILMGLPGSYVVATNHSYVGSLVELAGGNNVYSDAAQEFLNINTEDMLKKDPDIILRTAHAMPESVMEMFAAEFETNDIWKHFRAVQSGNVYDLPNESFGMSANFHYKEALQILDHILYTKEP